MLCEYELEIRQKEKEKTELQRFVLIEEKEI